MAGGKKQKGGFKGFFKDLFTKICSGKEIVEEDETGDKKRVLSAPRRSANQLDGADTTTQSQR